ncbi:MAG: cell division initiation protein [Actinomycetota bacterium]|jgi:cell division initiation protein|nr:cell division initiation protein [Actinomycetota bacterium]MEA2486880.1 cell division initiation protein [Actinomycetota bacterium]
MELSSRDIHEKQFHDAWRGYNQEEVDDFLDRIAEAMGRLTRENEALTRRVDDLDSAVASSRDAEEMLKKTLLGAQKAAEEAIASAKAKAEKLISEAEARVKEVDEHVRSKSARSDEELRRRSVEAQREYAAKKRDLTEQIEQLRGFEGELKQKLRSFLEQEIKSLDALESGAPRQIRIADASGGRAARDDGDRDARPAARVSERLTRKEGHRR